jgi:hypothetical protein
LHKILLGIFLLAKTCQSTELPSLPLVNADIDNMQNMFEFNGNQDIVKTNIADKSIAKFGLPTFGNTPIVDASFPLELAILFPQNGKLVLMDNQLNLLQTLNVFKNSSYSISHFGRSADGLFWIFNQSTRTIQKLNRDGDMVQESNIIQNVKNDRLYRIFDFGEDIFLQNGMNVLKFTPNLQYVSTEENTYMVRSYQSQARINMGKLTHEYKGKLVSTSVLPEAMPIGVSRNNYVLQTQNGLILQAIE